jgi:hypothetical protein
MGTIVETVTIVEAHVSRLLQRVFALSGVEQTPVGRLLYQNHRDDIFRSWENRVHWLTRILGLQLAASSSYQQFRTLVELRNALVHGDGTLTEFQSKDMNKALALRRDLASTLAVQVVGTRLLMGDETVKRGIAVARVFVRELDAAVICGDPRTGLNGDHL